MCGNCNYTLNPAGYFTDPCNCSAFYQCSKVGTSWIAYHRQCPPCLCFNQLTLACSDLADPNVPLSDPRCQVPQPPPTDDCARTSADPLDQYHYLTRTDDGRVYRMPCPPGTIFDAVLCHCVQGGNNLNRTRQIFCLDFDNSFLLNGVYVDMHDVTVGPHGLVGNSGYFNGRSSSIEVPLFTNQQWRQFSVSLWKLRNNTNNNDVGVEGLVHNGDCSWAASVQMRSESRLTSGAGVATTNNPTSLNAFSAVPDSYNTWTHHVLTYDGVSLKYYINNVLIGSVPISGQTLLAQCPLVFGYMYSLSVNPTGFFNGYMDEICWSDTAYSASDVSRLYNHILP